MPDAAETAAPTPTPMPAREPARGLVPLLVWLITILSIVWIPVKILSLGYLPIDDALRHAAKVVSGKSWADIMVLAEWVKMDHHAGWHAVLGAVQAATGWGPDGLVALAVLLMFCAFGLAPLFRVRRPEAWLAVLLLVSLALPRLATRMAYGRPLLLSAGLLMLLLLLWQRDDAMTRGRRMLWSVLIFAAAAWIHGSWCLFVLPVLAFAAAWQWQKAVPLGVAWLGGSLLGGIFTGHPIEFLTQSVRAMLQCFSVGIPQQFLAVEFRSSGGDLNACVITLVVLLWRWRSGKTFRELTFNAPFILAVVGFLLGLKTMRFWLDWGLPALLVWLVLQIEEPVARWWRADGWPRLAVTGALAAVLIVMSTSDQDRRWTKNLYQDYVAATDPGVADWMPEADGIIYNPQQTVFYRWFFKNPHAPWRYAMGFEPAFMTEDNLSAYRDILRDPRDGANYQAWVKKMRASDRLIINRPEPLLIAELEWKKFGQQTWIARLPRAGTNHPASLSALRP